MLTSLNQHKAAMAVWLKSSCI